MVVNTICHDNISKVTPKQKQMWISIVVIIVDVATFSLWKCRVNYRIGFTIDYEFAYEM